MIYDMYDLYLEHKSIDTGFSSIESMLDSIKNIQDVQEHFSLEFEKSQSRNRGVLSTIGSIVDTICAWLSRILNFFTTLIRKFTAFYRSQKMKHALAIIKKKNYKIPFVLYDKFDRIEETNEGPKPRYKLYVHVFLQLSGVLHFFGTRDGASYRMLENIDILDEVFDGDDFFDTSEISYNGYNKENGDYEYAHGQYYDDSMDSSSSFYKRKMMKPNRIKSYRDGKGRRYKIKSDAGSGVRGVVRDTKYGSIPADEYIKNAEDGTMLFNLEKLDVTVANINTCTNRCIKLITKTIGFLKRYKDKRRQTGNAVKGGEKDFRIISDIAKSYYRVCTNSALTIIKLPTILSKNIFEDDYNPANPNNKMNDIADSISKRETSKGEKAKADYKSIKSRDAYKDLVKMMEDYYLKLYGDSEKAHLRTKELLDGYISKNGDIPEKPIYDGFSFRREIDDADDAEFEIQ